MKVRKILSVLLASAVLMSAAATTALAQETPKETAPNKLVDSASPQKDGYNLVFSDEFDGTTLNTDRWNPYCPDLSAPDLWMYGNSNGVAVDPENVKVSDGYLHLLGTKYDTPKQVANGAPGTAYYGQGTVHTRDKFEPVYGLLEVKIKIPDVRGSNPAIWTMPHWDDYTPEQTQQWGWGSATEGWIWTDAAEIDILERPHPCDEHSENLDLKNKYQTNIHYNNYEYKTNLTAPMADPYGWNVFGMEWTPDAIKFYLNGELVNTLQNGPATSNGSKTAFVPSAPEMFVLSYGLGGWIGDIHDEDLDKADMLVDYVRWYQTGGEVSFDAAGAEGDAPDAIAFADYDKAELSKEVTIPGKGNLVKAHHTFGGWTDGEKVYGEGEKITPKESITLKAVWVKDPSVSFDANGAAGEEPKEIFLQQGVPVILPNQGDLKKEGYTFGGWTDGKKTYQPGDEINPEEAVTLKAVWVKDGGGSQTPGGSEDPGSSSTPGDKEPGSTNQPATGDMGLLGLASLMLLAGAGSVIFRKKNK